MTYLNNPAYIAVNRILREAEQHLNGTGNYPPYNIVHNTATDVYALEFAVAGFERSELNIEHHQHVLRVSGEQKASSSDNTYHYRGIAKRKFYKEFDLNRNFEVIKATLELGILRIELRELKQASLAQTVTIN